MNRRKIKKQIKKVNDTSFVKQALSDLRLIRYWEKIRSSDSKLNMNILTGNFYRQGKLWI